MKQYLNLSLIITLFAGFGIIFSNTVFGDFFGTPYTDFFYFVAAIVLSLLLCVITSNRAIEYTTISECMGDSMTDMISILLHFGGSICWFHYGYDLFPKNFISEMEFQLVFWLLVVMTIIASVEFYITLKNCFHAMLKNNAVKVNN